MWVSFAPESKLIVHFILGPRQQFVADRLIEVTDEHFSDSKRGRPKNPALIHDENLKYAQVVKKSN